MRGVTGGAVRPERPHAADESGATMVLVALLLFSLIAMSALVVDVGVMVAERRVLQNGADAAALAVARDCATTGCGAALATAESFADANADDGASRIADLCGSNPLSGCPAPPSIPAGARFVRVRAESQQPGGGNQVPFSFARVLGLTGATVTREAVVAWGGPASLTSQLPLTISECEFAFYTANGTVFATPAPPYPPFPASPERVIFFHTRAPMPSGCPSSVSGADLPGGFGWLQTSTDCQTPSSVNGWFNDKTGRPVPASCDPPEMAALVGRVVHVPVYDQVNGLNGANGQYRIRGFGAFFMTGYSITGQHRQRSLVTNNFPCGGNDSCISGYFVNGQLVPGGGTIGGPSMGAVVVRVVG